MQWGYYTTSFSAKTKPRALEYYFLHIRLAFPIVLPMTEIASAMGVPDESYAIQWRA
jgi:hypothetical protein